MIIMSGFFKISSAPQLVEHYTQLGMIKYLQILGIAELLCISLFIYKQTMHIGLMLLTGYFGGAIAVEISHGNLFVAPLMILIIVWVAAYMRNSSLFIAQKTFRKEMTSYMA